MMRFLLSHLRAKLMVLVLLPLGAGAALTALRIHHQYLVVVGLTPLTATSHLGARLGDLVHALQAERGFTALFQGAKGQAFINELRARRQATDAALQAFSAEQQTPRIATLAAPASSALQRLPALRLSVEGSRSAAALMDDYSTLVGELLALQDRLVQPAAGTPLETRFHALSALMHQKEQAELERAVLANAFSNQAFAVDQRDRFVGLMARQDAEARAFRRSAPTAWMAAYDQALGGSFQEDYRRIEQGAAASTHLPEVDPFVWFRIATARLEALKIVEGRFTQDLITEAEGLEGAAKRIGILLVAGSLAFGALVLAWTHVTGEKVLRPIHALEEGFARLRKGDLSVRLTVDGQDETARVTEAFNSTCEQLGFMTSLLKDAAHRVAGEAQGLSASADRVSGTTEQLAKSTLGQRMAAEQVSAAMLQLSTSVEDLETTLHAVRGEGKRAMDLARGAQSLGEEARTLVEGIRVRSDQAVQASAVISELGRRLTQALANVPSEAIRQALERSIQASEAAAGLAKQNGVAVAESHSRLNDLGTALAENLKALAAMDHLAQEIELVAKDQVAASREVSKRMQDTSRGTGEVQLAAAQLANTVPEVNLTAKELAGVAIGLASTADTFTLA
ncbi:MAG TPA: methyl-accepting chemotaxis protein [Holophagaceae bacterium]|nr:methyl-accepting chemotaxis protein [Holophagaceae bacterium]